MLVLAPIATGYAKNDKTLAENRIFCAVPKTAKSPEIQMARGFADRYW